MEVASEDSDRRAALMRTAAEQAASLKTIHPPLRATCRSKMRDDINQRRQLMSIASMEPVERTHREVDLLVAHLAKIHRLRDVEFPALREAARGMKGLTVPVSTQIMCEGERGDAFYVVLNGKLAATQRTSGNSGNRRVATLSARSCFGELALCFGRARSATVTALSDECMLLRLNSMEFHESIGAPVAANIVRECEELRSFGPFTKLPPDTVLELLYGFEHTRFKPKETLLMQAPLRSEEAACPLFFIKSGVAALFVDPDFQPNVNSRKAVISSNASSCTMVYAMSSGDVVGDWNLLPGRASAHAVALTMLTTYRISKAELFHRLPSVNVTKLFLADGKKHANMLAKHMRRQKQRSGREMTTGPSFLVPLKKSMPVACGSGKRVTPEAGKRGDHMPVPPFTMLPELAQSQIEKQHCGDIAGGGHCVARYSTAEGLSKEREGEALQGGPPACSPLSSVDSDAPCGASQLHAPGDSSDVECKAEGGVTESLPDMRCYQGLSAESSSLSMGAEVGGVPSRGQSVLDFNGALRSIARLYPGQQPLHSTAKSRFNLPGKDSQIDRGAAVTQSAVFSSETQRLPWVAPKQGPPLSSSHYGVLLPNFPVGHVSNSAALRSNRSLSDNSVVTSHGVAKAQSSDASSKHVVTGNSSSRIVDSPGGLHAKGVGVSARKSGRQSLNVAQRSMDGESGATEGRPGQRRPTNPLAVASTAAVTAAANTAAAEAVAVVELAGTLKARSPSPVDVPPPPARREQERSAREARTKPSVPVDSVFLLPPKDASRPPRGRLMQKIDYYNDG